MKEDKSKSIILCAPELAGRTDTPRIRALTGVTEDGQLPEDFFHVAIAAETPEGTLETARAAADFMRECGMAPPLVVRDDLAVDFLYRISDHPEDLQAVKQRAGQAVEMIFSDSRRGAQVTIDGPLAIDGRIYDGTVGNSGICALDRASWYLPETPEKPHEVCNYDVRSFSIKHFLKVQGLKANTEQHGEITAYRLYRDPITGELTQTASFYERQTPDGPCIVYHDIATGKTAIRWEEIRKHLAPDPEERAAKGLQRSLRPVIKREAAEEEGPIWKSLGKVKRRKEKPTLSTGIPALDKALCGGIRAGQLTILTGIPSSGKSILISQLLLHVAETGTKCGVFSGELPDDDFLEWFIQQAAGSHCVQEHNGRWVAPDDVGLMISEWVDERIYIYDNKRGKTAEKIIRTAETEIVTQGLGLLVFDNFMTMGLGDFRENEKNDLQTQIAMALTDLAEKYQVCIILVAHPKKLTGFLTPYDVSGTSNLYNLCDNLLAIHRHKPEVKAGMKKLYEFKDDDPIFQADNSIQIFKVRGDGTQDIFIPLVFHPQSRCLLDMYDPRIIPHAWEMAAVTGGAK